MAAVDGSHAGTCCRSAGWDCSALRCHGCSNRRHGASRSGSGRGPTPASFCFSTAVPVIWTCGTRSRMPRTASAVNFSRSRRRSSVTRWANIFLACRVTRIGPPLCGRCTTASTTRMPRRCTRPSPGMTEARSEAARSRPIIPSPGSLVSLFRPPSRPVLPHVTLPYMTKEGAGGPPQPGFFGGFLGHSHDPLFVLRDPNAKDFSVPELTLQADISAERLAVRRALYERFEQTVADQFGGNSTRTMTAFQSRAIDLLTSPETQRAFQLATGARPRARCVRTQYLWSKRPSGPPV